jgi:N-methylhydantoinase A
VDTGALFGDLQELFGRAYELAYTLRLDEPVEIVNWKVEAAGPAPNLGGGYTLSRPAGSARALKGARLAFDATAGRMAEWPVYDRRALSPGTTVEGPALIEERESTCVLGSGEVATVDAHYNLVAELEQS